MSPSPSRHYRSRMVYDLRSLVADEDALGVPAVRAACGAVRRWAREQSRMPAGFWRELTVRVSRTGGV